MTIKKPKFSVITVCKNENNKIKETIESILNQNFTDYEYIVIDGASSDNTYEIILSYRELFESKGIPFISISEKDDGIYSAMNKGIKLASGTYCVFMNGGDSFYSKSIFRYVTLLSLLNKDIIYGNTYVISEDRRTKYKLLSNVKCLPWGCMINHQSSFIKTSLLKRKNYSLNYEIASDYENFVYFYKNKNSFLKTNRIISNFYEGGISTLKAAKADDEVNEIINKYFEKTEPKDIKKTSHILHFDNKHNIEQNKGVGWHIPENEGTWAIGEKSDIFIKLKSKKDYYLYIFIKLHMGYENVLYVNGKYLTKVDFFINVFKTKIPKEMLKKGVNTISIKCLSKVKRACETTLDTKDIRHCNIWVEKIQIIENPQNEITTIDKLRLLKDGYISRFGFGKRTSEGLWCIGNITQFNIFIKNPLKKHRLIIEYNNLFNKKIAVLVNGTVMGYILDNKKIFSACLNVNELHKGLNGVSLLLDGGENEKKGGTKAFLNIKSIRIDIQE